MGRDREPTIIKEAKEFASVSEMKSSAKSRLAGLIQEHAVSESRLPGTQMVKKTVFGASHGVSFTVEVRSNDEPITPAHALSFKSGGLYMSFVFDGNCYVTDISLDESRRSGQWIGTVPKLNRRELDRSELVKLNEAMDLFEQNVGKGVNRD